MNSIAKTASFGLTENGLIVSDQFISNSIGFTPETRATREKGDIGGFSKASRLRFRRLLASARPVDDTFTPWGVCLTIPGPVITQERAAKLWHSWSTNNCRRSFADYPMIWRVELQVRRQPHWHLVMFVPKGRAGALMRSDYGDEWCRFVRSSLAVNGCLPWSEMTDYGFDTRGVRWQRLRSVGGGSADYLAPTLDHETKRKQDQLGWRGRQWGIINRSRLTSSGSDVVSLFGSPVDRIIGRFKALQERRRARGREYVGAGVGDHWRLPSVLFGKDADCLAEIVRDELADGQPIIEADRSPQHPSAAG